MPELSLDRWSDGLQHRDRYSISGGDRQWYRPLQINFNALSGGSLIAEFHSSSPGNQGLPLTDGAFDVNNTFSEGYWSLTTANSLVSRDFDLDLIANGFTSFPISAETRLLSRSDSDADWTADGISCGRKHINTISRDNVSIFDWRICSRGYCKLLHTSGNIGDFRIHFGMC